MRIQYLSFNLILLLGLFVLGCKADKKGVSEAARVETKPTPALTVYEDFEDFAPLLELNNDTVYVINFWATWCGPCVEEMPYFEQLHARMAEKPVKVLLVSMDFKKDLDIPATLLVKGAKKAFYGEQFASYDDLETWVQDFSK